MKRRPQGLLFIGFRFPNKIYSKSTSLDFSYFDQTFAPQRESSAESEVAVWSPEILKLRDGNEVPGFLFLPLLAGEEGKLMPELWDKLIPEEGDSVIVKGSSIVMLLNGGYMVDPTKSYIPDAARSDIDVIVQGESKIRGDEIPGASGTIARKVGIDGLPVDLVELDKIVEINREALDLLNLAIEDEIGRLELGGEQNASRQHLQRLQERAKKLRENLNKPEPEKVFGMDSLMPYEAVSLRLVRRAGQIKCYIVDPTNFLGGGQQGERLSPESQILAQMERNEYYGLMVNELNEDSSRAVILDFANYILSRGGKLSDYPQLFNTRVAKYLEDSILRLVRSTCESDIELFAVPEQSEFSPGVPAIAFQKVHTFAMAIAGERGELATDAETYTRKAQMIFARACFANPGLAVEYMFMTLPLGKFISAEAAEALAQTIFELFCSRDDGNVYSMITERGGDIMNRDLEECRN